MKKFGTPIGAGPGSDSEKVGLLVPGTPFPVGSETFFFALACWWPPGWVVVGCRWVEGFCFLARLGARLGAVLDEDEDEVEVELEVVLDDEDELEEEEDELELLGVELEVVVVLDELVLSGTQVSVSEVGTPATGGRLRLEIGVPGATLGTVKV